MSQTQQTTATASPSTDESAYCWITDSPDPGRNAFVLFRLDLDLDAAPLDARIAVFADTRYRLIVNEHVLSYGPARFYPSHPEHDTHDLDHLLRAGRNVIMVEVWAAGSPNFQSVSAPPVFRAAGSVRMANGSTVSLDSPGAWTARRLASRESETVPLSFAIGPVEILDVAARARELAGPWDGAAASPVGLVRTTHAPWSPGSIPAMVEETRDPLRVTNCGPGQVGGEQRIGCFRHFPAFVPRFSQDGSESRQTVLFQTWIHSPRDQSVTMGVFWSNLHLNGEGVETVDVPDLGNRQEAEFRLREGWNGLAGSFQAPLAVYGLPLGVPARADLAFHTRPDHRAETGFLASDCLTAREADGISTASLSTGEATPPADWRVCPPESINLAPAREVGWDRAPAPPETPLEPEFPISIPSGSDGLAMITLDFGREYFGRPVIGISCDHPVTLDLSYDEFLREDGSVAIFECLHLVHSTDRFHCPPGENRVECFHNRGGRYLQLNVRTAPDTAVILSTATIREFKTPAATFGDFHGDDDFKMWLWDTSKATLHASLEDIWSDSPWREQGCYLGDSYVQFHAHACLSPDMRLPARILRLFAQGQREDGAIPSVVPAAMDRSHQDFTLLYIRFLRDYWAHTGDRATVADLWPCVEGILAFAESTEAVDGLIASSGHSPFIDWSVEQEARAGLSSVVNALHHDALRCAEELAPMADADPSPLREKASRVLAAFQHHFWDENLGRYRTAISDDGKPIPGRGLHGNTIALARGLADQSQHDRVLPWLLGELVDNADKIIRHHEAQAAPPRQPSGQLELYFLSYLMEHLSQLGMTEAIDRLEEDTWRVMRDRGATTLWESIILSYFRSGSLCHSWSVAPLIMAIRHTLGVRQTHPGEPARVTVRPHPGHVTQCRGAAPHADGPIRVAWQIEDGHLRLDIEAPASVTIKTLPPPGWDESRFHATIRQSVA